MKKSTAGSDRVGLGVFLVLCLLGAVQAAKYLSLAEASMALTALMLEALILLLAWKTVIPVMIISLFFWVRYSFTGEDDLTKANEFMDKMGNIADDVKDEFR